jgi:2-amino-4-hydroxy-6-hydroxymethyldihydropteridine diphosphokinase
MQRVFISIGSNIKPKKNFEIAKNHLNNLFQCKYSSIYETSSEGFKGENFLNAVVSFKTEFNPLELRGILKSIENKMGRTEFQKGMSNRVIDLDIILYGDSVIYEDKVEIPSSDIENYLFVLEPLTEIAGDLMHPVLKISFKELLEERRNST